MLRNYQHDIKRRLVAEWEGHGSVMVQMPTGTGKTHLLASSVMVQMPTGTGKTHLLASLVNEELRTKNGESCVWIVAHRRELVEQIEETVARYGMKPNDGIVKVVSIQWLSRHWEDVGAERPSLIVIDEAHH